MALRWGIAGVGMISHDFLTALGTLPSTEHRVIAVAGKDLDKTHNLATLHKVPVAYEGFEALATDQSIDIVFVSVMNQQHYQISKLMLEHGKHVLCEKPLCMGYNQTEKLISLAKEKKLFLMEGMWSRFFPAYEALAEHIQSGGLGEIYQVNVQFGVEISDAERALMKDLGGGVVMDLGVYMLQFAQMIYKEEPISIVCGGHTNKLGVDESMSCVLTYPGGKIATLMTHTRIMLNNEAEVIGSKGKITLEQFWCPTVLQTSPANITEWTLPRAKYRFNFFNSAGLSYEVQECRNCINKGLLESPKMTWDESLSLARLEDTLRKQLGVSIIDD